MKLVCDRFESVVEWEEGKICSLVLENPDVFRGVISDLVTGLDGMETNMILSRDNKEIKISSNVELITSYIPFEVNTKRMLSSLLSVLEKEAVNEQHFEQTQELLAGIERYMDDLSFYLPADLEYKINVAGLLKMAAPRLNLGDCVGIEQIYAYMQFYREVIGERLFVFVNLREFYNEEDVEKFVNTVVAHKYSILLIDNKEYQKIDCEKRLIIDADRCEI